MKLTVGNGKRTRNAMWASVRGKKLPNVGNISAKIVDCSIYLLYNSPPNLPISYSNFKATGPTGRCGRAIGGSLHVLNPTSFLPSLFISATKVSSESAEECCDCLGYIVGIGGTCCG